MGSPEKDWEHNLCGCFTNLGVCIVTYFVPCYTAGRVADKVGDSCICHLIFFLIPFLGCFCGALERHKLRDQNNIEGSLCGDMITFFICPLCALVQEANEVDAITFLSKDKKDQKEKAEEIKPLKLERK